MQRQAQLDDAQVRGEVGRAVADQVAEHLAHLDGQLRSALRQRQPLQVARRFDLGEQGCSSTIPFQHISGQGFQMPRSRPECCDRSVCVADQLLRPAAGWRRLPTSPGNVSLPRSESLPTRFPTLGLVPPTSSRSSMI